MKIDIRYGRGLVEVGIPAENILEIIKTDEVHVPEDEPTIVRCALQKPVGSPHLAELAKGKRSACIAVSDITRPCPSFKFLPFLIDELESAGVADIRIVFGLGIHRKHTEEEKRKLVGEYVFRKVTRIEDVDPERFKLVGHTTAGTPVEVSADAVAADLLIATGNLEYHYFAGFSGGAKAVIPGISSRKTIQANHSMMLDDRAVTGNIGDNPVKTDIDEAGRMVGIDFLFNVVLDDQKRIIHACAGNIDEAYLECVKAYEGFFKKEVDRKADIVMTSPGGFPKDIDLYQSQKALDNVKGIVKDGGEIVLIASCEEGCGEKTFAEWITKAGDFSMLNRKIRERFVLGGHKAVAISKVLTRTPVALYSSFSREETERMGFSKVENLQKYIDDKIAPAGDIRITVNPTGRFVRYSGKAE